MEKADERRAKRRLLAAKALRNLFFYALVPSLILGLLAQPIREAVLFSDAAAFWILLAALAAVGLNWLVYAVIRRRRPSLLVFAHGVLCLLVVAVIQNEAVAGVKALTSTLSILVVYLAMTCLLLLSFWLATREARPPHGIAVAIWILLWVVLVAMAYRVVRDIESGLASLDTWITLGSMVILILGIFARRIRKALQRAKARRRRTGLTEGHIAQIIGETYFNSDDELATRYFARVQYTAEGVLHETRVRISWLLIRQYTREGLVGRMILVRYDPADPADAYVERIDRRVLEQGGQREADGTQQTQAGTFPVDSPDAGQKPSV